MTQQEKNLLEQARNGQDVRFANKTNISARFLRDHMLEIAGTAIPNSSQERRCPRWVIYNAVFAEQLDLSDGRRSGGAPLPAIEFHDCEFHSGFIGNGAHIDRLLFDDCTFTSDSPGGNFISLRNCRINSELRIENLGPFVKADDKPVDSRLLWVDAFAITIGTNMVVQNSLLKAPEEQSFPTVPEPRYALDLSTATIHCDLQLQPRVRLEGGLKMRDARIGGTVWAQGLYATDGETDKSRKRIIDRGDEPRSAFRAQSAHIRGSLTLATISGKVNESVDPKGPDAIRFWCEGKVDLSWLQLMGTLWLSGAFVGGTPDSGLDLYGARLGELVATPQVPAATLERLSMPQKLVLDVAQYVRLDSCRISGKCDLELKTTQLYGAGLLVEGNLTIRGTTSVLQAAGLDVRKDTVLALKDVITFNLGGASLTGKLDISDTLFLEEVFRASTGKASSGAQVSASNWRILKVSQQALNCYPGFTLSEITLFFKPESPLRVASFIHGANQAFVLTGDSSQFLALNQAAKVDLSNVTAAAEYLRLYCAYVWGPDGPFVIVEDSSALPSAFRDKIDVHEITLKKEPETEPGAPFVFDVLVRYNNFLFNATFEVDPTGQVRMPADDPVRINGIGVVYSFSEIPVYDKPFRLVGPHSASDFHSRSGPSGDGKPLEQFLNDVPDWKSQLVRATPNIVPNPRVLSLRDADIGHTFVISPLYYEISSVRQWPLTCYPEFALSEILLPADDSHPPRTAAFLHKRQDVRLLTGDSAVLHSLNRSIGLKLQDQQQACEYLRLFGAYTWADKGAFTLIERPAALPRAFRDKVKIHPLSLTKEKASMPGEVFFFDAYVRYGFFLYKAEFVVRADGEVEMNKDELVKLSEKEPVVYEQSEVPEYTKPFRIVTGGDSAPDFSSEAETPIAPKKFMLEVPDWSERLVERRLGGVHFDLRDASCGTLNDNAGRVWEGAPPAELEEFTYNGMFLPPGANVDAERDSRLRWLSGLSRQSRLQRLRSWARRLRRVVTGRPAARAGEDRPFRAQPYTQLAKAFRQRGDDEAARSVEAEKIRLAAYDRASTVSGRLAMFWWWWPYGFWFRFGLSPLRAFLTLLLLWFLGFATIEMLDENDLLKANVNTVASAVVARPKGDVIPIVPQAPEDMSGQKLPCGESIAPPLYAAELLIPILNLHQANRCDIRAEESQDEHNNTLMFWHRRYRVFHWMVLPGTWEYARAFYLVIGSIVTSLALLTFSGVARRWER